MSNDKKRDKTYVGTESSTTGGNDSNYEPNISPPIVLKHGLDMNDTYTPEDARNNLEKKHE